MLDGRDTPNTVSGSEDLVSAGRDSSLYDGGPVLTSDTNNNTRIERSPRADDERLAPLYEGAAPAHRTGPLYNAVSYPTKIAAETVGLFIATHTKPGDVVLDVFGGSGSTGLGALLCDRPTGRMVELAEQLGLEPDWGPRHAVVYELSVFGAFISDVMCHPPDPDEFRRAAEGLVDEVAADISWVYKTHDADGQPGEVRHIIWTDVLACPRCEHEVTYWDAAVRFDPLRLLDRTACPKCGVEGQIDEWNRVTDEAEDPHTGTTTRMRRRKPARIYGKSGSSRWQRPAVGADAQLAERAREASTPAGAPIQEIRWGDLHRSGYHVGMSHVHHFYTPRNFLVMASLWAAIADAPSHLRPALRLLLLSYNTSHSTLMTRVVVKSQQKDFVLTSSQSGVLYVSGLPVEKNVLLGIRRKIGTLADAFAQVRGSTSTVDVVNASSTSLKLEDESVAYVFTDPPFGGFIPYSEINQLNEAWLGDLTDTSAEAIVSRAQGKAVEDYGSLLGQVFSEIGRVLTPDGSCTVVFHSAKAEVWRSLVSAITAAGLGVDRTSVLDKVQASFKQTVSMSSVKGDPLMLLSKRTATDRQLADHEIVESVLERARSSTAEAETTRERLYGRYIGLCLENGVPINYDAADFYALVGGDRSVDE